jgi:Fic family protein
MNSNIARLDELKAQWVAAQPLKAEDEERLWKKFRLEWNYNSNHIEGNTLTYGETELLLIFEQTQGNHTLREYDEMKAHDLAVKHIIKLAEDRGTIHETDIRNLNQLILKEPYWKDGLTASGQVTQTQVIPGTYKRLPNNVRTSIGEVVPFASPTDTPAKMEELATWLRGELDAPTMHPIQFAAQLHHTFLLIHPFDDGNGRVARLLANFVLLREGFTPLIIKSDDKSNYIAALRNADVGSPAQIIDYFAKEVIWSIDLAIKASRGENIEDVDDLEKEMVLFVRNQQVVKENLKLSEETLAKVFEESWSNLFARFEEKMHRLSPLFSEVHIVTAPNGAFRGSVPQKFKQTIHTQFERAAKSEAGLQAALSRNKTYFEFTVLLRGFKGKDCNLFDVGNGIRLAFREFDYDITSGERKLTTRLYGDKLPDDEIERITNEVVAVVFAEVKNKTGTGGRLL